MAHPPNQASPSAADLVIRDVTVVSTRDGSLRAHRDVAVSGDRIVSVGPASPDGVPGGARAVDASGKYLVPGFNDMHAHMFPRPGGGGGDPSGTFDLMLAHGVTGFRQMSGSAGLLRQRAAGDLMPERAPRLLAMPGPVLTPFNAGTPQAAVATVRQQHDLGADFIKAALMTSEAFYAAQAEARRLGIPILGHLPNGIDVARASGEGIRSVEHLGPGATLLACCSTEQGAVRERLATRSGPKLPPLKFSFLEPALDRVLAKVVVNPANMSRQADIDILAQVAATFDPDAVAGIAQRFVADGTWQVPTLIRTRTTYLCDDPEVAAAPGLRYMAPATLHTWLKAAVKFARFPADSRQTFRTVYATLAHLACLLDTAGVRMLAGSDSGGAAWEVPGIALHQEFDELAQAGLPPLRILQMTTWDAAEFLGATSVMGTVDVGKHADLVLLDANPVESAGHLHHIAGVVRGGRYYGPADLDAIKDRIAASQSVS
jgi:hypothetical protein